MGLGRKKTYGGKGEAHSFEHRNLLALGEVIAAVTASIPAGPGATEATLISVLNAIVAADQDIEILLVRDTGNSDEVVQQITNYETGTPVVSYKDVDGAVYVPVGPLEYLDPAAVLNLMLTESLAQGVTLDSLETLLTTIDAVLDTIKTDTANLDVALSTRASEVTLTATNVLLTTIDAVLDTIKTDTAAMVVDLAAIEVLATTTNTLLTTIDTVLDNILATQTLGTSSLTTSVPGSATAVTLKALNTARKSLKITNDSVETLYVREAAGATTTTWTWKLEQDEMVIIDDYSGIVTGIWDAASGAARVTETT